ncbi:hypothetical protein GIB67_037899 [Kingdonia uniflora]|uniref:Uncharacterized protein n=1 Tax=Kingdonia uniflora TaxID=39325 RepID=A0A7J7LGX6_9MAGN|nr:hypothetical protein GIB67_037899 [Kingdonia uniflora]
MDEYSFSSMDITPQEQVQVQVQVQECEFEFGLIPPDSPTCDQINNSPADLLFFNGQLLPHKFPFPPVKSASVDYSRPISRVSSISSKDSFTSSRSNSSNSRSSISSARTSTSERSNSQLSGSRNAVAKTAITRGRNHATKGFRLQACGFSQKWQFIKSAPVLKSSDNMSHAKKIETMVQQESSLKKLVKDQSNVSSWFGLKLIRAFLSACTRCHGLQPSTKQHES